MKPRLRWRLMSALLGVALVASGGCSLVLDYSDECSTDADCKDGLVCAKKLCVAPSGGVDAAPWPSELSLE